MKWEREISDKAGVVYPVAMSILIAKLEGVKFDLKLLQDVEL